MKAFAKSRALIKSMDGGTVEIHCLDFDLFPFVLVVADQPKPNIVILFADELGYGELQCRGNRELPAPLRFGYESDWIGAKNEELGFGLPASETTIAKVLRGTGYKNGYHRQVASRDSFSIRRFWAVTEADCVGNSTQPALLFHYT